MFTATQLETGGKALFPPSLPQWVPAQKALSILTIWVLTKSAPSSFLVAPALTQVCVLACLPVVTCHPLSHTHFPQSYLRILCQMHSVCLKSVPGSPSQQDNPKPPTIYDLTLSNSPASTFDILPCFLDSSDTELIVIPQALCCFLLPCFSSSNDCLGWLSWHRLATRYSSSAWEAPRFPALGFAHILCIS